MFKLTLENAYGDSITFNNGGAFTISDIQGLNPPDATINTSELALMDGAKFNSAKVNMRQINIAFAIETQAAMNRINVYKVLKSKQYVKLTYVGQYRNVFIEGYIQSINIDYFAMKQIVTCTILCPSPYFKDAQMMINEMDNIISNFHFAFSSTAEPQIVFGYFSTDVGITVENDGDIECGMIIELYARGQITNPKIYNYVTQEFIGLNITMLAADLITIDTRQGQKSVTLLRNGVTTNIFNYVMKNSAWLQLEANGSTFVYEVGSGNVSDLIVTFNHYNMYEGV